MAIAPEILPDPVLCTVDVVLLTLHLGELHFAVVARDADPFRGVQALPGGFVHPQEDADARECALRVLREKAGVSGPYLEQLSVFSGRARDPRGWSVSIAWVTLVPESSLEEAVGKGLGLRKVHDLGGLPFDHADIVRAASDRVRSKSSYSSLPVHLCQPPFTLPELQSVYESLLGEPVNKVSFRRKMAELDFLEPVEGEMQRSGAHRPAQLWRLKTRFRQALSMTDRGINSGT
ncbi:MAG: NUDIX hydrolase [Fibrobacteria bacterium]|nr:NUDIX hydrolase [Fibrobacteria bacterium]